MKKHKLSCASAFLALLALCGSCSESDGPGNLEPTLWMDAPTTMTRTTAVLHGHVAHTAHSDLPSLTFRVSEDKMATADGTAGGIQQTFTSPVLTVEGDSVSWTVSGLTAGRRYTCVLQGRHGEAELQSNAVGFATLPNSRPALTAPRLLSCGPTSAILAYTVTDTGGEAVTATGVYCVNGATGQTTTLTVDPDSAVQHRARLCAGPLSQNTSYRFVAFAENSVGRTESAPLAFTTGSTVMLNAPGDLSLLMSSDLYSHTRLAFSGKMNGDDLRCLRRMMGRDEDGTPTAGQLTDVDLTEVTIVAGGGSYGSGRYAVADVVGYSLFADCDRLKRLLLPASATTLEKDALQGCSALRELTIPASASSVTPSSGCTSLTAIWVSGANDHYASIDGVLFNKAATRLVWFPMGKTGDYTLPSTVTAVGDYAFQQCHVTRFVLPSTLTTLGRAAFFGSRVEEVVMPEALRLVPTATFQQCTHLATVRLGTATELVSDYAFDGCPLADLYVAATLPPVCTAAAFSTTGRSIFKNCVLHVPAESLALYRADPTWGQFVHVKAMK